VRALSAGAPQHAKAEAQLSELGAEVRALRSERESREREALALRRALERLSADKEAADAAAASDKAYLRRLENKLAAADPERGAAARRRAAEAAEEAASLRGRVGALEDANAAYASEVATLRAALQLRAEELSAAEGGDVPARLLFAVAAGREDAVRLSDALAQRTEALGRCEAALASARQRAEALAHSEAALAEAVTTLRIALPAAQRAADAARDAAAAADSRAAEAEAALGAERARSRSPPTLAERSVLEGLSGEAGPPRHKEGWSGCTLPPT
jgi:colicin import membrane protein